VIVCPNCGKENQDHYKFCLGCGSDLPRAEEGSSDTDAPQAPTPPTGIPEIAEEEVLATQAMSADEATEEVVAAMNAPEAEPVEFQEAVASDAEFSKPVSAPEEPERVSEPMPEAAAAGPIICASCGAEVQDGFAFCGSCGTPVPGAQSHVSAIPDSVEGQIELGARLVLIKPDGSEGGHVEIPESEVAIGRDAGGFFASDPFLSPTHAILRADGSTVSIKDAGSLNGIFQKMTANEPVELQTGSIFRIGQELILFEEIDRGNTASDGTEKMGSPIEGLWGRIALIVGRGRIGSAFPIGGDGVVLGRERGNIIFPEDGYVSGLHVKIYTEDNKFYVVDLGSSNGSFVKLTDEGVFESGSYILMGQQLFRIDL
jgi:pSer/pThr/pTyr-binding forkhead associated (FHA) protein